MLLEENDLDLLTFYTSNEGQTFDKTGEYGFEANQNKNNFQLGLKPGKFLSLNYANN